MNKRIGMIGLVFVLTLVGLFILTTQGPAGASPLLQMTPGVDPMAMPTVAVPTPQPGTNLDDATTATGQMTCPMMGGSMTGGTGMTGMAGMSGMGMAGMTGSGTGSGMQGMGQMGNMTQMENMPMTGMQNVNDMLYNRSTYGWFYSINPWWLIGWLILVVMVLGWIGLLIAGIILLIRNNRKDKPAAAG